MKIVLATLVLLALVLTACGGSGTTTPATSTTAPPSSSSPSPTITQPTGNIDAAAIFQQNCSPCHGRDRQGMVGPALTAAALQTRGRTDQYIRDTITNGLRGMPVWGGKLTSAQIEALIQFLRS